MPSFFACRTLWSSTALPSSRTCPSSGSCAPPRIFINVLLPAPFSPINASTSPRPSDRETSLSATTPGKRLVMPRIESKSAAGASTLLPPLLRFLQLGEVRLEFGNAVFVDDCHTGIQHLAFGNGLHCCIALGRKLVHPFGGLVAKLEGLLHHGYCDGTSGDAVESAIFLVEDSRFDLALLSERFQRRVNGRTVVRIESSNQSEIGMCVDDVFDVRAGLGAIGVILTFIDDLDLMAFDRFLDPR